MASYLASDVSIVLLFLAFLYDFDVKNGYFEGGALSIAFIALYIIGFIPAIAGLFLNKKELLTKELPNQSGNKNSLAIIGTLLVLAGVCEILFDKSAHETVSMLVGIGICGLGIYFLTSAVKSKFNLTLAKLFSLLLGACMPVGMILGNNSNYNRHINSVENTLCAIFAVCVLLYILYEGNFTAKGIYTGAYFPSALVALHSGTVISLAYICAHLLGILNEEVRFYQMLLTLVLCVAIRIRLGDVAKTADSKTPDEWLEIENPLTIEEETEDVEQIEQFEEVEETEQVEETEEIKEEKETDE